MSWKSQSSNKNLYRKPLSPPTGGGFYHSRTDRPPWSQEELAGSLFTSSSAKSLPFPQSNQMVSTNLLFEKPIVPIRSPRKLKYVDDRALKVKPTVERINEMLSTSQRLSPTHRYGNGTLESPHKIQPFLASFGNASCFLGLDKRQSKACQTEVMPILRKEFPDIKDFRSYGGSKVDPFLKSLRKAIMANKPTDVEGYIIAFAMAQLRGEDAPQTIEDPEKEMRAKLAAAKASADTAALAELELAGRQNRITSANSIIRIQAFQKPKPRLTQTTDTLEELDDVME